MATSIFISIALIHLAAAISPGPSFIVCIRTSITDGFWASTGLAVGFGLGAALWACAALAGLAVLFELVPQVFLAMKLIGAGFLFFIAFMMWRHAKDPIDFKSGAAPRGWLSALRFGFLTLASNPKAAVFFGAIFVGLVPTDASLASLALLVLVIFLNETLWYIIVGRVFSLPRARSGYIALKHHLDRAFGSLLALFGLKIALG